jgi:hypothetical protein
MMARFRCGNEERENRYWTKGEERRCKIMCYEECFFFGIVFILR